MTEKMMQAPPGRRAIDQPEMILLLNQIIADCGADPLSREGRIIRSMLEAALKLAGDGRNTGELKLLANSLREMRYALNVFGRYAEHPKVSIFGSARTPVEHPDYLAAVEFGALMSRHGWLSITGAGDGIMKAGHEGSGVDSSFGLAVRLPFETTANSVIDGDTKLIHFKYFFTRKTMFLSQSSAVACFPGGFGTQDELMECLTLIQTGKSAMVPVVLLAGPDSRYWQHWDTYVRRELLAGGFISAEDEHLYYLAADPLDAAVHIFGFYANYHSSRYVRDELVIRMQEPLSIDRLEQLNDEFSGLVRRGCIQQGGPLPEEDEHLQLPRLRFTHTRRQYGRVRALVDRINQYAMADQEDAAEAQLPVM